MHHYKYLGTEIDANLSWKVNTNAICKKVQKRLYFLRRLRQFNVHKDIMLTFHRTFILSVQTSNFLCWYGALNIQEKKQLKRLTKIASRIIGHELDDLDALYKQRVLKKAYKIMRDNHHPLVGEYTYLPSGRRLRSMNCKSKRSMNSFVATSIRFLNDSCK